MRAAILGDLDALQLQPALPLPEGIGRPAQPFRHINKAGQRHHIEHEPPLRGRGLQQIEISKAGEAIISQRVAVPGIKLLHGGEVLQPLFTRWRFQRRASQHQRAFPDLAVGRAAIGFAVDQAAFGGLRFGRDADRCQPGRVQHSTMARNMHHQHRPIREARIEIAAGQVALFGQQAGVIAPPHQPFIGRDLQRRLASGQLADQIGNAGDGAHRRTRHIHPPRQINRHGEVAVRIDQAGQQRAALQIQPLHFRTGDPLRLRQRSGKGDPAAFYDHRRHRLRPVPHHGQDRAAVDQQIGGAGWAGQRHNAAQANAAADHIPPNCLY